MKSLLFCLLASACVLHAKLNVVTTLSDFAAIAEAVGGDKVKVTTIARGPEDPHFVDPRPSFIRVLNQADVLVEGGAELEVGWLPRLVESARNPKIQGNTPGHVVLAPALKLLDVPSAPVDRSQGDVHPGGNPHFWLDPENAKLIAGRIADAFAGLDAANGAVYSANAKRFQDAVSERLKEWSKQLAPFKGTKVVTYHKSFDYFLNRFGLELDGTIEPKPGLEPSPTHIKALIVRMKQDGVKVVMAETFRSRRTAERVAAEAGAQFIVLPGSVGGVPEAKDYFSFMDYIVKQLADALKAAK